ncbi:MAG: ABC transporter permease [Micrococcales bacterium]|nr:ABC transporter permease [Micrococcales bacterium]
MSDQSQATVSRDELHVYEAKRTGLPPIGQYFRDLIQRWPFAAEFSRSSIRAANTDTVLGRIWLVLNPLLLAVVYFVLVIVLSTARLEDPMRRLADICCGLFIFYMLSGSISSGAGAVTSGGSLITRLAFPRLLMPFAAVRTALYRFFPTVPVYFVLRAFTNSPWSWNMLLAVVFLFFTVIFSAGLAAMMATFQVYFRDTSSFLPYVIRIWLYLSPILWSVDKANFSNPLWQVERFGNPLFSLIGGWNELLQNGTIPGWSSWVMAAVWALLSVTAGSLLFMSRERDFAVRL